jgi:hypothetical protein
MKNFETKPSKRGADIDFDLDGETFTFSPPKQAALMLGMVEGASEKGALATFLPIGSMFSWLATGLNKEHEGSRKKPGHDSYVEGCQACRIHERLTDPDDDLDLDQVTEVINWLLGEASGRPTT